MVAAMEDDIRFTRPQVRSMVVDLDQSTALLAELPDATLPLLLSFRVLAILIDGYVP
jgi:hypothetical protein